MIRRRWLVGAAFGIAIGLLVATFAVYVQRGLYPADEITYIAAGERLNAGHDLYRLGPGDRYVAPKPPYWTTPLLYPPPIAVLWRPLAALPGEAGIWVWWGAMIACLVGTVAALGRRRPLLTAGALVALNVPIVYELAVGNVNAFLLLGVVGTWWLLVRGHDRSAGALVALVTALKLSPIALVAFLIGQRRWQALAGFVGAGLAIGLVSLAGAGLDAHLEYLGIVRATVDSGTSDLSLAGLARAIGVPTSIADRLPIVALVAGSALTLGLRTRPAAAYRIATLTLVFGSPVVNINTYTLLLALLAPAAWPMHAGARQDELPDAQTLDERSRDPVGAPRLANGALAQASGRDPSG
ncbi:MAG TPA: glycosyltransferase family 87 protein [Candidatus Limnocylindrales bacterium]|nr:glycosyltransferase family 87 protein [Candidatus Limnocylindrales bacterium]